MEIPIEKKRFAYTGSKQGVKSAQSFVLMNICSVCIFHFIASILIAVILPIIAISCPTFSTSSRRFTFFVAI